MNVHVEALRVVEGGRVPDDATVDVLARRIAGGDGGAGGADLSVYGGFLKGVVADGRQRGAGPQGRGSRAVVIDELGFLPLDADGAKPLFQVLADAHEGRSAAIATNLGLGRWGSVFEDDRMSAAVIDRIVHHGRLAQFRGESHRVRHALTREG